MDRKELVLLLGNHISIDQRPKKRFSFYTMEEPVISEVAIQELAPGLMILCMDVLTEPVMDILTRIKESTVIGEIPVIVLDAEHHAEIEAEALKSGAADYISLPFSEEALYWRMMRAVDQYHQQQGLRYEIACRERELERLSMQTLSAIANLVDSKDRYLKGHSMRVAEYSCAIAEKLHMSAQEQKDLYYMGMLHDIGKIGIPDTVFAKAGQLTDSEYSLVKQHTIAGEHLLKGITSIPHVADAAGYHHERPDGQGYFRGLKGQDIPMVARIVTIADAFDAMNTDRSYRSRLTPDEIRAELEKGRDTQFDGRLVDIMLELMAEGYEPQASARMENFNISSLAEEGNALLQRLFLEYTEEIKDISYRDSLTGLWNRGYIENQVNAFLRTRRHSGTFLMMDMDNFKQVNDSYGHLAGDNLLIQFGAILQRLSREEDIVCRFGGDEYVVFLKDLDNVEVVRRKAALYIQKLHEDVLQPLGYEQTSVSIGISMAPQQGNTFLELYQKADKALYYVKQHHKNGFQIYDAELHGPAMEE